MKFFCCQAQKSTFSLILTQQPTYSANRCITESRRPISDLTGIAERSSIKVTWLQFMQKRLLFLFIMAFCIKLKNILDLQKTCVINGGATTQYFKLRKVQDKETQFLPVYLSSIWRYSLYYGIRNKKFTKCAMKY